MEYRRLLTNYPLYLRTEEEKGCGDTSPVYSKIIRDCSFSRAAFRSRLCLLVGQKDDGSVGYVREISAL